MILNACCDDTLLLVGDYVQLGDTLCAVNRRWCDLFHCRYLRTHIAWPAVARLIAHRPRVLSAAFTGGDTMPCATLLASPYLRSLCFRFPSLSLNGRIALERLLKTFEDRLLQLTLPCTPLFNSLDLIGACGHLTSLQIVLSMPTATHPTTRLALPHLRFLGLLVTTETTDAFKQLFPLLTGAPELVGVALALAVCDWALFVDILEELAHCSRNLRVLNLMIRQCPAPVTAKHEADVFLQSLFPHMHSLQLVVPWTGRNCTIFLKKLLAHRRRIDRYTYGPNLVFHQLTDAGMQRYHTDKWQRCAAGAMVDYRLHSHTRLELVISAADLLIPNLFTREGSCCIDYSNTSAGCVPLGMLLSNLCAEMDHLQLHVRDQRLTREDLCRVALYLRDVRHIHRLTVDWCGNDVDEYALLFLADCLQFVAVGAFEFRVSPQHAALTLRHLALDAAHTYAPEPTRAVFRFGA